MEKNKPEFPEKLFDWSFSFSSRKFKWENVQGMVAVGLCVACYLFFIGYAIPQFERLCLGLWSSEKIPWGMRMLIAVEHNFRPLLPVLILVSFGAMYQLHRSFNHLKSLGFPETHWLYRAQAWKYSVPLVWVALCTPLAFAAFAMVQVWYEFNAALRMMSGGYGPH